jgi:hypothetical protein
MSHIPSEHEVALAKLEETIASLPFKVEVTIHGFNDELIREVPRGYVEEGRGWHKIVEAVDGMITKEITVFLK